MKKTKLELSENAKQVINLCKINDCIPDDLVGEDYSKVVPPNIKLFIEEVLTSSDDFWYSLTNGYVNYKSLLANDKEVEKVELAIKTIEALHNVVREVGLEY